MLWQENCDVLYLIMPGFLKGNCYYTISINCDTTTGMFLYNYVHFLALPSGIASGGCFHCQHKCDISSRKSLSLCLLYRGHGLSLLAPARGMSTLSAKDDFSRPSFSTLRGLRTRAVPAGVTALRSPGLV